MAQFNSIFVRQSTDERLVVESDDGNLPEQADGIIHDFLGLGLPWHILPAMIYGATGLVAFYLMPGGGDDDIPYRLPHDRAKIKVSHVEAFELANFNKLINP